MHYLIILISLLTISCDSTPQAFPHDSINTYSEAVTWVKKTYQSEALKPDSSLIYKLVYFPEGHYMLVYFHSNKTTGHLYQKVPRKLWLRFKRATSKGQFYHSKIKTNKAIQFTLKP